MNIDKIIIVAGFWCKTIYARIIEGIQNKMIYILTEGRTDKYIIDFILSKSDFDFNYVISSVGRSLQPDRIKNFDFIDLAKKETVIVVFDQEYGNIVDEIHEIKYKFPKNVIFCPAIPNVESWLMSDIKIAEGIFKISKDQLLENQLSKSTKFISQFAKNEINRYLRPKADGEVGIALSNGIGNYDINSAMNVSPSLRYFVQTCFSKNSDSAESKGTVKQIEFRMDRSIFSGLLQEKINSKAIIYRDLNGHTFTAAEMQDEIIKGTKLGKQYMASVLRTARDLIAFESEESSSD